METIESPRVNNKKRMRDNDSTNLMYQSPAKIIKNDNVRKDSTSDSRVKSKVLFHENMIQQNSPRPTNAKTISNQYKSSKGAYKWPPDTKNQKSTN